MSDQTPNPTPEQVAQPPVQAPQPPVTAPIPTTAATPELDPNMGILVRDADDSVREITLNEMYQAWRGRGGQMSDEDKQTYELFNKTFKQNDAQALKQLVDKLYPTQSQGPATPVQGQPSLAPSDEITALRQQVEMLRQNQEVNINPVVSGIAQLVGRQRLTQEVQKMATGDKFQAIQKLGPVAVQEVEKQLTQIAEVATQHGINLATLSPQYREKVMEQALTRANDNLSMILQAAGVTFNVPATTPQGTQLTNDQSRVPGHLPALLQIDPNNLSMKVRDPDAAAQITSFGGYGGQGIPRTPVQPVPGSGAPGPVQNDQGNKSYGMNSLEQRMNQRLGGGF